MTAFLVILRQSSPQKARRCKKCCRLPLNIVEIYWQKMLAKNAVKKCCRMPLNHIKKNCCRIKSKNSVKKSCRKTLYNTIFFDIFRQISPKTSRRCEKCGRILAKNAVEYCQKKLLSNFIIRHYFQTAFFDKEFVEKCGQKRLSNQVEKSYQKKPLLIVEKYRQKMFVNNLTTKFVKLIF